MDELSALPPSDSPRKKSKRVRTTSTGIRQGYPPSASPVSTRAESPLQQINRASSTAPRPFPERLEILAPTPRRHLLDSSASQQWLHTPPLSPTSSRAGSPASAASSRRPSHSQHTSFSALLQHGSGGSVRPSSTRQERADAETSATMGRRWIRWMHKRGLKQWVVPMGILAAVLVKACIGLGSYSGKGTPPMYGDYEAQRHWMELTIHLPFRMWYTYDLQYWGLDYPPLTAYVSWVCGKIGSWIEPSWFALDAARGIETPGSKVFMRSTVIALDLLVYIPALLMFASTWQGSRSKRTQHVALLTLLFQPALLLIDSGHFQYNSVMLGLTLFALNFFATGQDLLGAVCFVLSLGFKQMALYYAPAIGSYLLAKCIYLGPSQGGTLFTRLAAVTVITFLLLFLPFLPPFAPISAVLDPITRIFPFARGLFEDKVANFWCASNVVFKWKNWASRASLVKLSTGFTALGFLPTVFITLRAAVKLQPNGSAQSQQSDRAKATHTPFLPLLPYALLNSAMSFFLFSFQVHEKTILLPLLPMTLLLSAAHVDSTVYSWGVLVNNVAVFSMWPLLKRDGLGVQYIATLLLWNRLVGCNPFRIPQKSFIQIISAAVYSAAVALHILEFLVSPPSRYPDIYPVLNVLISTPVFILAWLWSIKGAIEVGWALGGPGPASVRASPAERRLSVGESIPTEGAVGSYRQAGGRAVSLGYGQSRRRAAYGSSRASSVTAGGPE
ncbi:putative ALG6 ALG8 glucosyltransferase family protein [Lyophyllum shimeji]|uniref:Alpha-1,3-glucosyltransferase n=1 Tax=Lyophyllum shimeji TaxID=47721 RepID=A0A9P3PN29_LYOSH|nr:putative ALG6 ALG8 glucosyltransferase family protein [Lyophyllum shimeji]